ncbi:MAG: hypothetical protein DMF69_07705 [Acidobacteria bacterium]|nr:MAG: hypothetical protein DMF69_07705 [Acidobacteriota bacterium]
MFSNMAMIRRMKVLNFLLSVFLLSTPVEILAQQKRQTPKPPSRRSTPAPKPVETPTFDTLLASDCYKIYVEARGVGQLIRSDSVNELLEPVMKLAAPPKEFKTLVKWLNTNADEVLTSRMLVATWATAKDVPEAVIAIEFDSAEAAAKFAPRLNSFLPKVLPTPTPEPSTSAKDTTKNSDVPADKAAISGPPKPSYYLKQLGSLIVITPTPLTLKNLRPAGSKLLSEDQNFKVARNRFTSEQLFVYVDISEIEKEDQERQNEFREERQRAEEEKKEAEPIPEPVATPEEEKPPVEMTRTETTVELTQKPDPLTVALGSLTNTFFMGQGKWPQGIGAGISLENESLEIRALMISAPGEKADVIPIFPFLIPAAPIVPNSPSILPADTELLVTASLDFAQMYAGMSKRPFLQPDNDMQTVSSEEIGPFAELEKKLNIKIKDDLLPLLGSELVVSMPVKMLDDGPRPTPTADTSAPDPQNKDQKPAAPSVVVALALRDKEGMRALLPRIVEGLGFKGASVMAQTQRREDTEMVSYGNALAYAFIQNFLVVSADPASIRHVVDSYLKHETLSSDQQFRNYTRWQPRQLQAQVYLSPALMESYKTWATDPGTLLSDQTREFLSRVGAVSQSVTYSLSNDGLGALHELHVPKSLVLMAVAGISEGSNPSPLVSNERAAMGTLYQIAGAQNQFKAGKGAGGFGSVEDLVTEGFLEKEMVEGHGYKIEVTAINNKFTVTATPLEYGKTGRTSYFMDESMVLRGGDHGGSTASVSDRPIQ